MDSHIVHPRDQDLHVGTNQGEDEDHHEKKSVMKKVKEKARKIKDTLKKQGHGHEQDQEDDDDDDKGDEDQETHVATTIGSGVPGQPNKVDSGKTSVVGEGLHPPQNTPISSSSHGDNNESKVTDPSQTFHSEKGRLHAPQNTPVSSLSHGDYNDSKVADPNQTFVSGKEGHLGQSRVDLDQPRRLEEPPHAPKANPQADTRPNYETKVTDPTRKGGEEVGVTPILHSFDKMNINAGTEQKPHQNLGTGTTQIPASDLSAGSHDQFSADKPSKQGSTYTEKITSATSTIADKAISAKNVVASKLGYGGNNDQHGEIAAKTESAARDQQGKTIAATMTEKLAPVYEKVAGAGSTVMSKIYGGGGGGATNQGTTGQEKGGSVKDYLSEKLRPGEEDRALSDVISETLNKRKAEPAGTRQPEEKVTESEEVTRRLGTDYGENDDKDQSRYGRVVADTLKGAVGSLFGKSGQTNQTTSEQSPGSSPGTQGLSRSDSGVAGHQDQGHGDGGKQQRLEGSGN